ncbi:MAG: hypothetical protein J7K21_00470 [Desulfurococcales archaeon]|nr:hypothetical protein [Desulfurococcales archaeon]
MTKARILHAYGPHPSRRAKGYILVVDPIGLPKKCPYNCVYCPVGETVIKSITPVALVPPNKIVADTEYVIKRIGCGFKAVLFGGSGDAWLNPWLPLVIDRIIKLLKDYGCNVEYWAYTTGFLVNKEWSRKLLGLFNKIYLKIDTAIGEDYQAINRPHENARLSTLKDIVREVVSEDFIADITLIDYVGIMNSSRESIETLAAFLDMAGIKNILLNTINRPPLYKSVKPVTSKIMKRAMEVLIEHGFNVELLPNNVVINEYGETIDFDPLILYNHLLRRPLLVNEVSLSYRLHVSEAAMILEQMVEKGFVIRNPWRTKIYYRGVLSR